MNILEWRRKSAALLRGGQGRPKQSCVLTYSNSNKVPHASSAKLNVANDVHVIRDFHTVLLGQSGWHQMGGTKNERGLGWRVEDQDLFGTAWIFGVQRHCTEYAFFVEIIAKGRADKGGQLQRRQCHDCPSRR